MDEPALKETSLEPPGAPGRAYSLQSLIRAIVWTLVGLLLVISVGTTIARFRVAQAQAQLRDRLIPAQTAAAQLGQGVRR